MVATKAGSPLKTVKDVIAFAKANPGKLNFGSINPGSNQHLSGELFKSLAGIAATTIPFKTTPELLTGVIRGDVDVAFEYQAACRASWTIARSPRSRRRRVSVHRRSRMSPPSTKAGFPATRSPAGMRWPRRRVRRWKSSTQLNAAVNEALKMPDVIAATTRFGMEARGSSVDELRERIKRRDRQMGEGRRSRRPREAMIG